MQIFKNFITEDERRELLNFYLDSKTDDSTLVMDMCGTLLPVSEIDNLPHKLCLHSILKKNDLIYKINDRIKMMFDISEYRPEIKMNNGGAFAMILEPGYKLPKHVDPNDDLKRGEEIIRFNLLIQEPDEGGELYISNNAGQESKVILSERDLIVFEVSHQLHRVSEIKGTKSRVISLFSIIAPRFTSKQLEIKE